MPDVDFIRSEIERMRVQAGRQRKEILQLQRAGIGTASAEALLSRMQAKIDDCVPEPTLSSIRASRAVDSYQSFWLAAVSIDLAPISKAFTIWP
ncbi:hypothetical protein [Bradyrhizobium sp. RT5a]|uniref:hypothetical protein n=1 Tax=Bradyrhizobium sp. RT5a TaxID=3156380 RepID=UPI003390992F